MYDVACMDAYDMEKSRRSAKKWKKASREAAAAQPSIAGNDTEDNRRRAGPDRAVSNLHIQKRL